MPTLHSARYAIDFKHVEDSLTLYTLKLRKLQRVWLPLQIYAPHGVLVLWIVSVLTSLITLTFYHWLFTAPAICILIALKFIIEQVQLDFLLMTEETRYLLGVTRDVYKRATL